MRYLSSSGLVELAAALARDAYDVYAPRKWHERLIFGRVQPDASPEDIEWNDYRLAESVKPFWFQSSKVVAKWTEEGPQAGDPCRPRAVFGVKACDLRALGVLDKVFRDHDFQEPNWCGARDSNLIVAGDCTGCAESCFCTLLGDKPYPRELFDLSLAPVEGGYLVDVGSEKGQGVVDGHASLFLEPKPGLVEARDATREEVEARLAEQNRPFETHDPFEKSVDKNMKTRLFGKLAATCVECNACNTVCPTCHCFMLHAVKVPEGAVRLSMWDSCFQGGYARMAGGGTPRLQLVERFKNHYFHKFVSFPRNWGVTACSGCGRCIDACMGRIDKRECLRRLETEWLPSDVLEEMP